MPAICLIFIHLPASSQVTIAPTALYIHSSSDIASLQVSNGYTTGKEISVSFDFGYLSADHNGDLSMVYNDSLAETRFGLDDNIRAFPRRFILPPGSCQTVRVQVRNMNDKPDGVYWSRIIISSRESVEQITKINISEGIGTKIDYVIRHNLPVFYRKGDVSTGLIPGRVVVTPGNGKLITLTDLKLEGNAPFNGSVTASISSGSGSELAVQRQTAVVYFDMLQKIEIQLPEKNLAPGDYFFELLYETKRSDIASSDLVQAKPVYHKTPFEIK